MASLTIPILQKNIAETQYKTAWKKEYSSISNAFNLILADNAGTIKNVCPKVSWILDSTCIMNLFIEKMRVQKKCSDSYGCWHTNPLPKDLSGNDVGSSGNSYPSMILQDGTLMKFHAGTADCTTGAAFTCINIVLDTNGFKLPNTLGKDIFQIVVKENKLIFPFGTADCKLDPPSGAGYGCAVKYLID